MKYDVIIVGASFAGLTLAHHLPPGLKVLILEQKRQLNTGFESTGLITSVTRDLLKGFTDVDRFIPNKITTIAVVSPDYDKYFFSSSEKPWIYSTDTPGLIEHMAKNLPENVTLLRGATYKKRAIHHSAEHPVVVKYSVNGDKFEIEGRFLVGADGGHSRVAATCRTLSNNQRFLAGLERVFYGKINLGEQPDATVYHFWFGAFSLGYGGWLSPTVENGRPAFRVGLAKLGKDIAHMNKLDRFIDILIEKKIISIEDNKKPFYSFGSLIPIQGVLSKIYDQHTILLGDAAGFCGAFAADGIKGAVLSGQVASRLIPRHLDGDDSALTSYKSEIQAFNNMMTYYRKQVLYRWIWDRMKRDRTFHAMYDIIERQKEHFIDQFCDSKDKARGLLRLVLHLRNIPLLFKYSFYIFLDLFVKRRGH